MFQHLLVRRLFGFLVAIGGALLARYLNMPLPWLLGPLLCMAALRLASAPVAAYRPSRTIGHWIIGTSLGLYFSVEILNLFTTHWLAFLIGALCPLLLSAFGTVVLHYIGKADLKTAWFSSAIGGASEMSTLAERYDARVDLVASAHCLRMLAVVILIPFGFRALVPEGQDFALLAQRPVDWSQLPMLFALTGVMGYFFSRLKIPTAWVLGSMAVAAALSISGLVFTSLPTVLLNVAQLLLGWNLGDNYRPAFFKAAPRFLLGVAIFTAGALGIVMVVGYFTAVVTDLPLFTVWLGLSPGGLAEIALTAKVLGLGVPLVTAFQVTRLVFVVMITGWMYQKILSRFDTALK